jgi:hypothetical protein
MSRAKKSKSVLPQGVYRSKSAKLLKEKASLHDLCCAQRMLMDSVLGSLQETEFSISSMASIDLREESASSAVANPDLAGSGDVTLSQPRLCQLESGTLIAQRMQAKCLQDLHLKHEAQYKTMLAQLDYK